MNKGILLLIAISIGLSAYADYTVTTQQPLYNAPVVDYPMIQPYPQPYAQPYYQNPYQAQYQGQCVNPYQYQAPYLYRRNLPYTALNPAVTGLGTTTTTGGSVAKNIGQSILYSMLRGY